MHWHKLWRHARIATMQPQLSDFGLLEDAAIATVNDKIVWIGANHEIPSVTVDYSYDCAGQLITPGLIDSHTHLVYAGNRANEFSARLNGATYADIAAAGGGIMSTVTATRSASEQALYDASKARIDTYLPQGVTCIEIKSGYGLDIENECKMLRVAKALAADTALDVRTTFLGAHVIPPEFKGQADAYIDFVCEEILPKVVTQKLANSVDVFCESIAFSLTQAEKVFQAANTFGLDIHVHAEQLTHTGVAALAAQYGALSADHLEYLDEPGVAAMAQADMIAVLLPAAFYYLRESRLPPIDLLRQYQVPMALASDCNPGTAPTTSLLLMQNMACTLWQMTPLEAFLGVTRHSAQALGLSSTHGQLAVGRQADLVVWDADSPADFAYQIAMNPCVMTVKNGDVVYVKE